MTDPYTILALDVGDVRIGVASASSLAKIPSALTTISRVEDVWGNLARLVQTEGVQEIVVGLPRNQSGDETQQTAKTKEFIAELRTRIGLPVMEQDESLTSVKAEQELAKKGAYSKADVDALAATYILEDYLAVHRENA